MFPYKTRENKGSPSCLYLHVVTIHKYTCNLSPVPKLSSTCGNATEAPLPFSLSSPPGAREGSPPCDFIFTQGLSWSYEPSRPLKVGDEHHEVLQGPRMFLKVTLGPAPSSAMFRAQRGMVGSQALPVSEASGSWWVCNKVSRLAQAVIRVLGGHGAPLVSCSL